MRKIFMIFISLLLMSELSAQEEELFIPTELQKAYDKGTRSYTGEPGPSYFQNQADYTIEAEFNPETGLLNGSEVITYQNNSPDTLGHLTIRVYMNFFRKGAERDFGVYPSDLHGGVDIRNFKVDGKKLNSPGGPQQLRGGGTVQLIELLDPLEPGGQSTITLDWEVQLPTDMTVRMGKYGEDNNWFVAYWYPHVAVYDDISGWDTHPFTGSAEFYYDFSDFEVKLTLPGDYMVWATGLQQNTEETYKQAIVDRMKQAKQTEEVIPIVTPEDHKKNDVLRSGKTKTWHFKADKVPDFAFAVSKNYIWDATSVEVDAETGRRTFVSAVYDRNSKDFHQVAEISRKTIKMFSEEIFGVPFAYPQLTAFNGSGGMEFPMMINDGDADTYQGTVHLTAHEIGHNYFPFTVMTNESYYAFMDEGMISFLPREVEGELIDDFKPFRSILKGFEQAAGNMNEVPLMVKSYMISDYSSYRLHAYVRPANAFYFLRKLVGEEKFHKALKTYIERWSWKHPTPYDFFFTFEDVLDTDLSWFWKPWFFEFGYPDLAIGEVRKNEREYLVEIRKMGNLPLPVLVKIEYEDGTQKTIRKKASVWKEGNETYEVSVSNDKKIRSVQLGSSAIPDVNHKNNEYSFQ